MRIAFVSYEFPPETGGGGIGTYLAQIVGILARAGHDVQVFAGSPDSSSQSVLPDGGRLHRIATNRAEDFRAAVLGPFLAEQYRQPFDVMEGTDFDASAIEIKRTRPEIPYVVKLHTPRFAIDELHARPPSGWSRMRMTLGSLRRGRWPRTVPIREQAPAQTELESIRLADEIAAPSQAIADAALRWTSLRPERISIFPYPFEPGPEILSIPAGGSTHRITFLGRLETRKGVLDLSAAIPLILRQRPDARFRFIGRTMNSPLRGVDMQTYLEKQLAPHAGAVEFLGPLPSNDIPGALAETDILVAPSHWESFGVVCCEGMAAARAVIGSNQGGMVEILDNGRCGVLVPPHCPEAIVSAVLGLLEDPSRRRAMGVAARQWVLSQFSAETVLKAQLSSYQRAILRAAR